MHLLKTRTLHGNGQSDFAELSSQQEMELLHFSTGSTCLTLVRTRSVHLRVEPEGKRLHRRKRTIS
jgi:hypothetical protein